MGYKTARGACVAYHVRRQRELPQAEAIAALGRGVRRKRKEERLRRQEERRKREKERIPLYVKHISTRGRKGKVVVFWAGGKAIYYCRQYLIHSFIRKDRILGRIERRDY